MYRDIKYKLEENFVVFTDSNAPDGRNGKLYRSLIGKDVDRFAKTVIDELHRRHEQSELDQNRLSRAVGYMKIRKKTRFGKKQEIRVVN